MDDVILPMLFLHQSMNITLAAVVHSSFEISMKKIIMLPICAPFSLFEPPWSLCSYSWLWCRLVFTWCECIIYLEVFFLFSFPQPMAMVVILLGASTAVSASTGVSVELSWWWFSILRRWLLYQMCSYAYLKLSLKLGIRN